MNKKIKYSLTIVTILLIVFGVGVILFYPVPELIEDRPILTLLCKVNPLTYETKSTYTCTNENYWYFQQLRDWEGYHGCNESTKGYDGEGHISKLKTCATVVLT